MGALPLSSADFNSEAGAPDCFYHIYSWFPSISTESTQRLTAGQTYLSTRAYPQTICHNIRPPAAMHRRLYLAETECRQLYYHRFLYTNRTILLDEIVLIYLGRSFEETKSISVILKLVDRANNYKSDKEVQLRATQNQPIISNSYKLDKPVLIYQCFLSDFLGCH